VGIVPFRVSRGSATAHSHRNSGGLDRHKIG